MPGSDETYLESFIEHVATLPHAVRRNMDLMKDLDQTNMYVMYSFCDSVRCV